MVHTYGTNMQQSVWQLSSHFLKTKLPWKQCKRGGSGRTQAFQRALAKIHSKKFKFYTKHLTLRVYKKMVLLGSGQYLHKLFTKKVVCSVLLKRVPFFLRFSFSFNFLKR